MQSDARFLESLWQEPQKRRFLGLTAEMMLVAMTRRMEQLRGKVNPLLNEALQILRQVEEQEP